jgi:ATP-dependent Lhr-like helicase
MVCLETWDMDELFGWIKTSYPYRQLTKDQFDLVLNMLAGRYADSRIRELKPRISIDRLDNTVSGKKGSLLAVFMSGGTIPDRGYFQLRHHETGARIGELDEEYVWEARLGQVATIGTQNWRIQKITHNDVFAAPAGNPMMNTPFWKSEDYGRDFHFSKGILDFLENANDRLDDPEFKAELGSRFHMSPAAIRELIDFLKKQKEKTESELPHRHHLLLEYVKSGPDGAPGTQLVIHTLWGGQLNKPFSMALDAAWEQRFGERLEIFPGNDCVVMQLAHAMKPEEILTLVKADTVEELLRLRLEGSGFFSARFRECAGRALLITKNKVNQRMPLWMNRLRSQKLMEGVLKYDDFPILLETWRTCLQDEFDLDGLKQVLEEIETGEITWSIAYTSRPSPFASGLTWNQVDKYMYQVDQPASTASALRSNLLQDVVFNPELRPEIPQKIVALFEEKRQRLFAGYTPQSAKDLIDWVKERILIPQSEWKHLTSAIERDSNSEENVIQNAEAKLVTIRIEPSETLLIAALEYLPRILAGLYAEAKGVAIANLEGTKLDFPEKITTDDELGVSLLSEWIQFYGPRQPDFFADTLGLEFSKLSPLLDDLQQSQTIISGELILEDDQLMICDAENFESLLRLNRAEAKPVFKALPISHLPLFIAHLQGLTNVSNDVEGLFQRIEQLVCLPQPADLWETEILPARMQSYQLSQLDTIIQEGELGWLGTDKQKVAFCFLSELDLMKSPPQESEETIDAESSEELSVKKVLSDKNGRFNFATLQQLTDLSAADLSESLWHDVWNGELTNDSFASLRKGIEHKFQFKLTVNPENSQRRRGRRSLGRSGFAKYKGTIPYAGNWFLLPEIEAPADLLEQAELEKDRVRLLLDRYGILFREIVLKELPELTWRTLFRSLRLMELSGEVLSGYFFEHIPGPQFISHQAFRVLQSSLPEDAVYWLKAADPASVCGLPIDQLKALLPKRVASSHMVFKGTQLVLRSERNGKALTIDIAPDNRHIQEILAPLRHLLYRQFMPLKQVVIETINQQYAAKSPYVAALKTSFEVLIEHKKVTLYRKL